MLEYRYIVFIFRLGYFTANKNGDLNTAKIMYAFIEGIGVIYSQYLLFKHLCCLFMNIADVYC